MPDLEISVSQSSDDAGPYGAPIGVTICSTSEPAYAIDHDEIYFGHCPDDTAMVTGMRFTGVALPQGAVIEQARLEFTVDGPVSLEIDLQIRGTLTNTTSTFGSSNRPDTQAPLTAAIVPWNIPSSEAWTVFETEYSPDITAVIQEIVNQGGWQSGNGLTLIVEPLPSSTPNLNRRVFTWDREKSTLRTPKLQIWYTIP